MAGSLEPHWTRLSSRPFVRAGSNLRARRSTSMPTSMRIRLAATGRFLAVVPASILKFPAKHPSIKVLPVELPTTRRQIGIITLKNRTLSPLAQLFIECAREIAKPMAKVNDSRGNGRT